MTTKSPSSSAMAAALDAAIEIRDHLGHISPRFPSDAELKAIILKHMQIPEGQWIKCSERMPEDGILVLAYDPTDESFRQEYREEGAWAFHANDYEHFKAVGGSRAAGPDAVCVGPGETAPYTYWLPLPAPPKGDEPGSLD